MEHFYEDVYGFSQIDLFALYKNFPGWALDKNNAHFKNLMQVISSYLDTLYLQTKALARQKAEKAHAIQMQTYETRVAEIKATLNIVTRDPGTITVNIPDNYKVCAINIVNIWNSIDPDSANGEYYKLKTWIDSFMKIPFNNYCKIPVHISDGLDKCNSFLSNTYS